MLLKEKNFLAAKLHRVIDPNIFKQLNMEMVRKEDKLEMLEREVRSLQAKQNANDRTIKKIKQSQESDRYQ
jgi:uncharacterized protein YigA (DUF484 family)